MNATPSHLLALATLAFATQAAAQVTFYEHPNFRGESFTVDRSIRNMERPGYNTRASSAVVRGEAWEICDTPGFSGRCVILHPGEYPSLGALDMNDSVTSLRPEAEKLARGEPGYAPGPAHITLYGRENFEGRAITVDRPAGSLGRLNFDQRASSAVVHGSAGEVCDDERFGGRCMILQPGRYPSLAAAGMDNRIASVRRVDDERANARIRRY